MGMEFRLIFMLQRLSRSSLLENLYLLHLRLCLELMRCRSITPLISEGTRILIMGAVIKKLQILVV